MFCRSCGQHLDDNVRFCLKCGTPVVKQTPTEEQPSVQNTDFSTEVQHIQEVNEPQVSLASYVEKPRDNEAVAKLKASNRSVFMLIAIALYTAFSVYTFLELIEAFDDLLDITPVGVVVSIIVSVLYILCIARMVQIALMTVGLFVNCGCSLTSHGMNPIGVNLIKSSVIVRMVLRALAIIGIGVLWYLYLDAINTRYATASDSYIHLTKSLVMTVFDFKFVFILIGVVLAVMQIVPLIHEFFILSALKSMRITAKTEELRLKGYKAVYVFNWFFIGVKSIALILVPILANAIRGLAYETGISDVKRFANAIYESAMPDVLSVVFSLCLIAAMVLFSINSSKYQKENTF